MLLSSSPCAEIMTSKDAICRLDMRDVNERYSLEDSRPEDALALVLSEHLHAVKFGVLWHDLPDIGATPPLAQTGTELSHVGLGWPDFTICIHIM